MRRTKNTRKDDKTGKDEESAITKSYPRGGSELPPYVIDSSSATGKKLANFSGEIVFDNVNFAYPTRKQNLVFREFSLMIPRGKTVRRREGLTS